MERYYVRTTGNRDRAACYYYPENPGTILCGSGHWRRLVSDTVMFDGTEYTKVVNRHHGKISGVLRLNSDGTVEEIEMYATEPLRPYSEGRVADDGTLPISDTISVFRTLGGSVRLRKLLEQHIINYHPELKGYVKYVDDDLYGLVYDYYKKHGGNSTTFMNDFMEAFVRLMKKRVYKYELHSYIPRITKSMFIFEGGSKIFDVVRVIIPLTNPTRGKKNLKDVIEPYKKEIFMDVYSKIEKYSGIPKGYFKMDNCTLTHDECLSFIFSIKELEKREA